MAWVLTCTVNDNVYLRVDKSGRQYLHYYLSPFDAMLEAIRITEMGEMVSMVDTTGGTAPRSQSFFPRLHLAWQASNGRIMLGTSRLPTPFTLPTGRRTYGEFCLRLDEPALKIFDHFRELAGLYAWEDAIRSFDHTTAVDFYKRVRTGWKSVPKWLSEDKPVLNQYAILDPETGNWHFVPLTELAGNIWPILKHCCRWWAF